MSKYTLKIHTITTQEKVINQSLKLVLVLRKEEKKLYLAGHSTSIAQSRKKNFNV